MFKKIIIASAILAATSTAFADGAYVGGNLGINHTSAKLTDSTSANTNLALKQLTIGGFAGYGATVSSNIYLGGEAFVNAGSASSSTKQIVNGTQNIKLSESYSYGLDFMPGYKVSPETLIYAKIGVVATRFNVKESTTGATGLNGSASVREPGVRYGFGVQQDIQPNLAVRGEFIHTNYHTFNTFSTDGLNGQYKNRIAARSNQVLVGLVYKFD